MPPSFNVHRTGVLNTSAGEFAGMSALPNEILPAPAAQVAVLLEERGGPPEEERVAPLERGK